MSDIQIPKPAVIHAENEEKFKILLESSIAASHFEKAICVFCGSSPGKDPIYTQTAEELGKQIAAAGYDLVYGGGNKGLMGTVSRAAANAGKNVTAIFPWAMSEVGPVTHATNVQVRDMHNRKKLMNAKIFSLHNYSDRNRIVGFHIDNNSLGFITLPGGIGTLEELLEMATWNQLGVHSKFVGILNVNGIYDHLEKQIAVCVEEGFLSKETQDIIHFSNSIPELLELFASYDPSTYKPYFNWV